MYSISRCNKIVLLASLLMLTACAGKLFQKSEQRQNASIQEQSMLQFEEALVLQKSGQIGEAKVAYEKLHELYPQHVGPLANLGVIALEQDLVDEAEEYFLKVLDIDEKQKYALNYLGVLARKGGQFEKAEIYYRKALDVDSEYPEAIRNLGILLDLYRGRLEEALALYEQYQQIQTAPDPMVNDWIYDTKSRLNLE